MLTGSSRCPPAAGCLLRLHYYSPLKHVAQPAVDSAGFCARRSRGKDPSRCARVDCQSGCDWWKANRFLSFIDFCDQFGLVEIFPVQTSDAFETAIEVAILTLNIICICVVIPCFIAIMISHEVRKAHNAHGCGLVCFGALMTLVGNIFVPRESDESCHAAVWLLGIGFTIILVGLFVKSWTFIRKGETRLAMTGFALVMVLIDVIINAIWQALDPQYISLGMCRSDGGVFEWIASAYVFFVAVCTLIFVVWGSCRHGKFAEQRSECVVILDFIVVCLIGLGIRVSNIERNTAVLVYALGIIWATMVAIVLVCLPVVCLCGRAPKQTTPTWKRPSGEILHTSMELLQQRRHSEARPILETARDMPHEDVEQPSQESLSRDAEERRETERRDTERRDMERRETERRESERRETEQRREMERREMERRDVERRDVERRDMERRDMERREMEAMTLDGRDRMLEDSKGERADILDELTDKHSRAFQTPHRSQSARRHHHVSRRVDRQERRERRERTRRDVSTGGSHRREASRSHRREASGSRRREASREDHGLLNHHMTAYPQASPLPPIDYFRRKDREHRSHSHTGHRSRHQECPPTAPSRRRASLDTGTPLYPITFSQARDHATSRLDVTEPVRVVYALRDSPVRSVDSTTTITFEDLNLDLVPETMHKSSSSNVLAPREWRGHSLSNNHNSVITFS